MKEKGHIIVIDNFFHASIALFKELLERGTYATEIIGCNRVGLPEVLKSTKAFNKNPQVILVWCMHKLRQISAIIWKDKNWSS